MDELPKFMLKPFADSYGINLAEDVINTETAGGEPRQRQGFVGSWHTVTATYKHRPAQHQYFLAFRNAYKARAFWAYLLVDDVVHRWYRCRFIKNGQISPRYGGGIFTVAVTLSVEPIPYDIDKDGNFIPYPHSVDEDLTITAIYEMTNGESDKYFNMLEKLVNQDLPQAMRGF